MAATPSGMLTTTLNYYLEPSKGGNSVFYPGTAGDKRRKHVPVQVQVQDLRKCKENPTLDRQGFQLIKHESCEKNFDNEERIKTDYYEECIELVKKHISASRVLILNHVLRLINWRDAYEAEKHLADTDRFIGATYGQFVHIDQSYHGAIDLLSNSFPEHSHLSKQCRWAIINLWRPIHYNATNNAIAVADARSIPEEDLRELTAVFDKEAAYMSEREKEKRDSIQSDIDDGTTDDLDPKRLYSSGRLITWGVVPTEEEGRHQWYYVSEMRPEEALLLKIFDSKTTDNVARRCPHSSFVAQEDFGPDRHSLEVRCLVFWEDQPPE